MIFSGGFVIRVFAETSHPHEEVTPLYLHKNRLHSGKQTLTVRTTQKPGIASLDPFHKRIERSAGNTAVPLFMANHVAGTATVQNFQPIHPLP